MTTPTSPRARKNSSTRKTLKLSHLRYQSQTVAHPLRPLNQVTSTSSRWTQEATKAVASPKFGQRVWMYSHSTKFRSFSSTKTTLFLFSLPPVVSFWITTANHPLLEVEEADLIKVRSMPNTTTRMGSKRAQECSNQDHTALQRKIIMFQTNTHKKLLKNLSSTFDKHGTSADL